MSIIQNQCCRYVVVNATVVGSASMHSYLTLQPYDFLNKLIKFPYGNTVSIGAIEECISASDQDPTAPFHSRYIYLMYYLPASIINLGRYIE
jgi:hypothetical protein